MSFVTMAAQKKIRETPVADNLHALGSATETETMNPRGSNYMTDGPDPTSPAARLP
jgi:hypothetical protein